MVDLCHSLCTMPICIWLMWTRGGQAHHTTPCHHDPGFIPLWWRRVQDASVCACTSNVSVSLFMCVGEQKQRLHLVWAIECASLKHTVILDSLFWSGTEVEWCQAESSEESHLRRPLMPWAPSRIHSLLYSWAAPLSLEESHTVSFSALTSIAL